MKLLLSPKEKLIIAAVSAGLLLLIFIAQFYFLSPLKSDLQTKQQTLQSEQKLLADLRKKAESSSKAANENTTELQKQLPVEPLEDQFILNLQQAEAVSNSQIKSMSFTESGKVDTAASSTAGTANNTNQAQTAGSNSNTNNQASGNTDNHNQTSSNANNNSQTGSSPDTNNQTARQQNSQSNAAGQQGTFAITGLNKLTAQLNVESPNYQDLEKFIDTLESLKRIVVVEAINYTGSQEITSAEQEAKPLTYTLTVSAYYMPGLTDLRPQLPKVEYPAPANKVNPLAQFPDLTAHP